MRYVAAYLLATLGGAENPSVDDLSRILSSVGIEVDNERASKVVAELKGKKIEDVIAAGKCHLYMSAPFSSACSQSRIILNAFLFFSISGSSKLASVPSGGAVAASGAAPAAAAAASSAPAAEAKKEEKKEEEEEEDDDMGFGLFD